MDANRDASLLLQAWGLGARQVGFDLGRKGLKDEEIVVLLRRQRNPHFSPATQTSISRTSAIEAIAWWLRVLDKMKWLPSFAASCVTPVSTLR